MFWSLIPNSIKIFVLGALSGALLGGFVMMHMTKQWGVCRGLYSWSKCVVLTVKDPW